MTLRRLIFPLLLLISLFGCTQRDITRTFDEVETFIMERPDSALAILDTMDRSRLQTDRTRARHALLHAMALDKNFIDVSEDSIAQVAVDYYSKRGPRKYYARSLYYLGLAYYYQEDYNKAIVEFTKAENVAQECDSLYLGMTKVAQADTYGKTYNIIEEENSMIKSFNIFNSISNTYYLQSVLLRISQVYYNTHRIEKSEDILNQLINDISINDNIRSSALTSMAFINVIKSAHDYPYADSLFSLNYGEYAGKNMTLKYYWAWAYSLSMMGRNDEAQDIIDQLESDKSGTSSYWQYMIAKSQEDFQSSLSHLEDYVKYNDIEVSDALRQSLALSQRDYYESQSKVSEYKAHNARLTMWIIILMSVFALFLVFISIRMYVRKQNEVREGYLQHISEIKHQLEEAKREDYPSLKKKYISLYRSRFETIGALYEQFVHSKDLVNAETSVYNKVSVLVEGFTEDYSDSEKFEAMLDEDMDNIMSNLHIEVPGLKKKDYVIFSLFVIGFDVTTISHLLNTTMNTIYIRKSRIRHQIEELNPLHKQQFLEVLDQFQLFQS